MSELFSGYRRLNTAEAASPAAVPSPAAARSLEPGPAAGTPPADEDAKALVRELKRLLEERTRQWHTEAARAQRVFGVLIELASELCMAEFDAELKRRGELLRGSPDTLKDFITAQIKPRLDASALAGNLELAAQHQALQGEHARLQGEHSRLSVIVEQAESELAALRERLARDETEAGAPAEAETPRPEREPSPAPRARADAPDDPAGEPADTEGRVDRGRVDELVRLVAATGLARLSKIREKLATAWRVETRSASMRNAVNAASGAGFIKLFEARAEWRGAAKAVFVELTAAGLARAQALGVEPAPSEIAEGVRRGFTLEHLNLILRAADILKKEGYRTVQVFPGRVMLPDGQEHRPMLAAAKADGRQIYIECERAEAERGAHWQLAALANGGGVWLMTTTPAMQTLLVSEINLARTGQPFALKACNVGDYAQNQRGRDKSMWLYQS